MTVVDPQTAVQSAIYSVLTGSTYFTSNSIAVYDSVPKDTPVPYVTIGDMTVVDNSTDGIDGQVIFLNIHSWDQNYSTSLIKTTMANIKALLHETTLSLGAGLVNVNTRFQNSQTFKDPDGLTLHGVQRFRIVVETT